MAASTERQDGSALLMRPGRDGVILFGSSPQALCRVDEHGWLGLSGEASADLNMAAVLRTAPASFLDGYVDEIEDRGLDAILIVDEDAPHLDAAALARELTPAGAVPLMVRKGTSRPNRTTAHEVRLGGQEDVVAVNAAVAEAFSLDELAVQQAMPPSFVAGGADIWMVEAEGTIAGSGVFVRSDDHVGIYCMATRSHFQRRGIGRAVLEAAMSYYLDDGVTTFTLEATAAGIRLYEQVGFTTAAQPSVYLIGASTQFPAERP